MPINTQIRLQVLLERLKRAQADKNAATMGAAIKSIAAELAQLQGSPTKKDLAQLSKQIDAAIAAAAEKIQAANDKLNKEIGKDYIGYETDAIKAGGAKGITKPSIADVSAAAATRPLAASGALLEDYATSITSKAATALKNAVARGYTNGLTTPEIVRSLVGTKALKYKDGLGEVIKRDVETLTRTSIQHVANAARLEVWRANTDIVDGYQWVSTLDSRTTEICQSLDGQRFAVDEGPIPPAHYNCRSTTVAVVKDAPPLDDGTRASEDGPVPAKLTYFEWLKQQPDSFQDAAIGETRAKLLRDGGLSPDKFAALQLGRNFEPMTLAEMRAKAPEAFKRAGLN